MAVRVVRLGSPRQTDEGLRIGTVRRPPRGVPAAEFASRDYYDVWMPELAPSEGLVKTALAAESDAAWGRAMARYRREMQAPSARHLLALLAALSGRTDFSVGCYCDNERRCHRSVLGALLGAYGAVLR